MHSFYRRQLPHWQVGDAPHFVTWRLHGSLPKSVTRDVVKLNEQLDAALTGPTWLKQPQIAEIVTEALRFAEFELELYELLAWVVMANHVHVVIQPRAPLFRITHAVKGYTARQANRMLGREGHAFWQHESFDRWIRDRYELERAIRYVERNPVVGGLVEREEDWEWSSACAPRPS